MSQVIRAHLTKATRPQERLEETESVSLWFIVNIVSTKMSCSSIHCILLHLSLHRCPPTLPHVSHAHPNRHEASRGPVPLWATPAPLHARVSARKHQTCSFNRELRQVDFNAARPQDLKFIICQFLLVPLMPTKNCHGLLFYFIFTFSHDFIRLVLRDFLKG